MFRGTMAAGAAFAALAVFMLAMFTASVAPALARGGGSINVAAAASLTFPLREVAAAYERETSAKVVISFASTGILASQIEYGAPFDLFLAADTAHVERLEGKGLVEPGSASVFVHGRIVVVVNKASGVRAGGLAGLTDPRIRRIAIANPAHAPYGRAAMEALQKAGLWDSLRARLVYGENVRQTLLFVQTGNAEAGIVALSVAGVPEVVYTPVPEALHNPIEQAAAVIKGAANAAGAKAFLDYLRGPSAMAVFEKYGFVAP
ncbi:MAG: molybdate ABC transporter substrate-binding protein [Thermodesulfobacteriota bacterium]